VDVLHLRWWPLPTRFKPLPPPCGYSPLLRTSRSGPGPPVAHSDDSARTPGYGSGPRDLWGPATPRSDQRWSPGRACRNRWIAFALGATLAPAHSDECVKLIAHHALQRSEEHTSELQSR